jgi:hypothetical protein
MGSPIARVATAAVLVALLSACGGGSSKTSSTSAAPSPQTAKFCASMAALAQGSASAVGGIYNDLEANAPSEIRSDVEEFVRNGRAVSSAFSSAGASTQSVDVASILRSLPAEQQQFVSDLQAAASGTAPGAVGRVLRYVLDHCSTSTQSATTSSSFSTTGSAVN